VDNVFERVKKMVDGAALMADVEGKVTVQGGDYELLINMTGARLIHSNLTWLGPIQYTPEEQEFARSIQRANGVEETGLNAKIQPLEGQERQGGSTDVGDVSWMVPTLHLSVTTAPEGTPWHAWPVVACAGMSIGHKGMIYAAKTLAATMIDLCEDAKMREAVQAEFREKTRSQVYKPYIPEGPPPLPTR
jgi:aminobenzoyl-glutamate utilization protein B